MAVEDRARVPDYLLNRLFSPQVDTPPVPPPAVAPDIPTGGGGRYLMNRLLAPPVDTPPSSEPLPVAGAGGIRPPYNIYDPNGPEVAAGNNLRSSVAGGIRTAAGTSFPQDTVKPYNIYDPNGPEVAAGNKLMDSAMSSVRQNNNLFSGINLDIPMRPSQNSAAREEILQRIRDRRGAGSDYAPGPAKEPARGAGVPTYVDAPGAGADFFPDPNAVNPPPANTFFRPPPSSQATDDTLTGREFWGGAEPAPPSPLTGGILKSLFAPGTGTTAAEVPGGMPSSPAAPQPGIPMPASTRQGVDGIVGGNSPQAIAAKLNPTMTNVTDVTGINTKALPGGLVDASLSPRDLGIRNSVSAIDQYLASGNARPSQTQLDQVQQIRQQAGFLRGGTDRGPLNPDGTPATGGMRTRTDSGLDIQFNPTVDAATRANVMQNQGANDPIAQGLRATQQQQFLARTAPPPENPLTAGLEGLSPGRRAEAILAREKMAAEKEMAANALASGAPGRAATTALTQKQADSLPESTAAEIAYKQAKTEEAKVAARSGNFKVIDTTPDILGNPKQNQILDVRTGKMVEQAAPVGTPTQAQLKALTPAQQKAAADYRAKNKNSTLAEVYAAATKGA